MSDTPMLRGDRDRRARVCLSNLLFLAIGLLLSTALTDTAWAAPDTNFYGNRVSSGDGDPIYEIDLTDGSLTQITGSLFPSAAIARSPSSGLLYYTQYNVTDSQVATYNIDTDIHNVIGNLGAGVDALARLGFRANGTLYGMDNSCELYTINTATGVATSLGTVTGVQCDSGDLAFGTDDVMYVVGGGADDTLIWTINLGTLVGTQVHDVQTEQSISGMAFAHAGAPYTVRSLLLHYSPTWVETTIGAFGGPNLADAAASPIFSDLSLAKVVNDAAPNFGNDVVFTLTVTNAGPVNATDVVVTDLLPSGYTYVSDDGGGDYVSGTGIWTVGAVATGVPEVLNITATVLGSGTYDNGAEITAAGQFDTDSTPDNDIIAEDDQVLTTVTPTSPGLIAHWNFDEGTGQTVGDSSGNGNNGTRGNDSGVSTDDPTWTCVVGGNALTFDGTEDWVNAGDIDAIDGEADLTVTAWVRSDNISAHKTVMRKGGSAPMWQLRQTEGVGSGIRVGVGDQTPDGATGDGLLSAGVWGHWAMVFDGSKATNDGRLKVYFDGVDQGPLTFANGPMPTTIPDAGTAVLQIGQHEFFSGAIDEVRIYDGPLTSAEVSALAATAPVACATVVNSTRDVVDLVPGNGACDTGALNTQGATECTLRAAIQESNALAGTQTIGFNIPTTELGYSPAPLSYTIQPGSALPPVTAQIVIDGSTQPDFPGTPIIVVDGVSAGLGAKGLDIEVGGTSSTIRGLVINNFDDRGIHLKSTGNTIVGNWIGLDVDGVTAAANNFTGLFVSTTADGNTIGGSVAADRNVVSGNSSQGMQIQSDNNVISGNYIGTNSSGTVTTVGNTSQGIRLSVTAENNMIGGATAAEANIIAGNANDGIDHRSTGTANSFLRNSIYSNGAIGIDLSHNGATADGADGVTENDALDPDPGSNNLLNFPVITAAPESGGTINVDFDLDVPAGNYRIEFFTNPSGADPLGNGEGEVFQSNTTIAHGGTGIESFSHSFAGSDGDILTATATLELAGPTYSRTSEFGDAFTATVGAPTACPSGGTVSTTVDSVTGDSLRACIIWANGNAGVDTITVPAGTYTLTLAGAGEDAAATGDLDITDGIIINGNAAAATIVDGNSLDRVFDILGASATFSDLTVSGGSVTGNGAGIDVDATGSLTMSTSTVSSNTATADGGGIATAGGAVGLTNVTLSANTADRGGAMDCTGACTLTNVTVSANTAPTAGDGVRQTGAGTITFLNTIVANNLSGGVDECDGSAANLISTSNNLSSDASCDFTSGADQVNADPLLGLLADNGGPTFTHALLANSPANDGGTNTGCPATDQRGTGRPLGSSCDIGAYEAAAQAVCPGAVVTNTGDAVTGGSLRACITWANGNVGADSISFNIAGAGPHTIRPASAYPNITDTVTIDGSTEPDFVSDPMVELDGTFVGGTGRGLWVTGTASGSTIRGLVINSYNHRGIQVNETNVTIVGNWIGLDVDGVTAAGNASQGLYLTGSADNNTIGGTLAADRNVISANTQGIHVRSDNNVISGNYIGTNSSGTVTTVGNTSQGIRLNTDANNNMIGGTTAAHANIIAGNNNDGIDHRSTGTANSFLRNSIHSNGVIGIDLAHDGVASNGAGGVTENDAGDIDPAIGPAANNLLNFPVITAAVEIGGTLNVDYDLDVIPAGNYRIEFFTNPSGADPLGNGEGEVFQSNVTIAHGGAGLESFSHSFAGTAGDILTVTATLELAGPSYAATSEFGDAFTAVLGGLNVNSTRDVSDLVPGNGACDTGALNTQGATECTLRAAIEEANALAGADTIAFNIPTTELGYSAAPLSYTISLGSAYPSIGEQLNINGATQPDFPGTPIIVIDGTSAGVGAHGLNLAVGSDSSIVRGLVINNFQARGIHVVSASNTIAGNWIGLNVDGVTAAGNGTHNISLSTGADNTTVGGTLATDRNVISASSEAGIIIQSDNNDIIGNYIGTNSSGAVTTVGNTFTGVRIESTANNITIGGTTVPSRNIIAGNGFDGIRHNGTGVANSFLGNSIHSNTLRGIDIGGDNVTENDAGDPDAGGNNLLNFPVITTAAETAGTLDVNFDLDVPAGNYRIEFFTNPSGADASGNGEGEVYQDAVTIAHGGTGVESFSHSFAGSAGDILTVTATEEVAGPAYNATSEFGDAFTAVFGSLTVNSTRDVADLVPGNGACDTGALNTQGATECTLRAAIEEANALAGADTIGFNIPTTELGYSAAPLSYTITLGSAYASLSEQVTIDGATQPDFPGTPIIVMDGISAGVGAAGLAIDGTAAGSTIRGLVINNFDFRGIDVNAINNTIVGNWIGLDVDGVTAAGNNAAGIFLVAANDNNTIGGAVAADRNVISANGVGIWVQSDNNLITGNYIGTNSSGAVGAVGNLATGVRFASGATGNTLGGTTAAEANIIADNVGVGIVGVGTSDDNSFLRNSVYANSALGIDLGNDSVTENDAGDPDTGANNLLNFPDITAAWETAGTLDVDFDLDVPAGNYRIEFFTNPSGADASGNGEGEVFQSAVTIAHGGTGVESFNHSFAGAAGDILTVTATEEVGGPAYNATSEFGDAFTAVLFVPEVVKRSFETDGTVIPHLSTVPGYLEIKYLLYINNKTIARTDVSVRDVLVAAFQYQTGTIQVDNSVAECAAATCTPAEELAIFTAVNGAAPITDAVDGDAASYTGAGLVIDAGDQNVGNPQLNINADAVWAILFSVKMP